MLRGYWVVHCYWNWYCQCMLHLHNNSLPFSFSLSSSRFLSPFPSLSSFVSLFTSHFFLLILFLIFPSLSSFLFLSFLHICFSSFTFLSNFSILLSLSFTHSPNAIKRKENSQQNEDFTPSLINLNWKTLSRASAAITEIWYDVKKIFAASLRSFKEGFWGSSLGTLLSPKLSYPPPSLLPLPPPAVDLLPLESLAPWRYGQKWPIYRSTAPSLSTAHRHFCLRTFTISSLALQLQFFTNFRPNIRLNIFVPFLFPHQRTRHVVLFTNTISQAARKSPSPHPISPFNPHPNPQPHGTAAASRFDERPEIFSWWGCHFSRCDSGLQT